MGGANNGRGPPWEWSRMKGANSGSAPEWEGPTLGGTNGGRGPPWEGVCSLHSLYVLNIKTEINSCVVCEKVECFTRRP